MLLETEATLSLFSVSSWPPSALELSCKDTFALRGRGGEREREREGEERECGREDAPLG